MNKTKGATLWWILNILRVMFSKMKEGFKNNLVFWNRGIKIIYETIWEYYECFHFRRNQKDEWYIIYCILFQANWFYIMYGLSFILQSLKSQTKVAPKLWGIIREISNSNDDIKNMLYMNDYSGGRESNQCLGF